MARLGTAYGAPDRALPYWPPLVSPVGCKACCFCALVRYYSPVNSVVVYFSG